MANERTDKFSAEELREEITKTIADLQRLWRGWVFATTSHREALRQLGQLHFQMPEALWEQDPAFAKSLTFRFAQTMPYVSAMVLAIEELEEGVLDSDNAMVRCPTFYFYLPPHCVFHGAVPRPGSLEADDEFERRGRSPPAPEL